MSRGTSERNSDYTGGSLKWSEIDKIRFYTVGTGMYSALNVLLHPITVIKIRQQVLNSGAVRGDSALANHPLKVASTASGSLSVSAAHDVQHQPTFRSVVRDILRSSGSETGRRTAFEGARGLYRGLGIVLTLAVPARALYIATLEGSREGIGEVMTASLAQAYAGPEEAHAMLPLVATVSGGLSGGLAALVAQVVVVPMDVISQKQMIMDCTTYAKEGNALAVYRSILRTDGPSGLYRGFGLSMLSSLPTGSIWWATYGGCQHKLQSYIDLRDNEDQDSVTFLLRRGTVQLISGLSAALVASTLTQPLDVVKTRLQVGVEGMVSTGASKTSSPMAVARELAETSGIRGFFRGTGPRIMHMGLWGTVLSSAYEILRHVSRKDYHVFESKG